MDFSPKLILKDYNNKDLNKSSATEQLISLIENAHDINTIVESIKILGTIKAENNHVFNLLENLLISDSHEKIRYNSAKILYQNFLDRIFEPMKFAFYHEKSVSCLLVIVEALGKINDHLSKSLLIDKIKRIDNEKYKRNLNLLFKTKNIEDFTGDSLAEIVKNYIIFNTLELKFNRIDFNLRNGLLIELDLSNVSSHISRSNILKSLPNFIGELTHLKKLDLKINRLSTLPESICSLSSLKFIDLSYNKIKYLPKSIGSLKSLKTLYLRYNDLKSIPNSISSLNNLRILDLRVNKLTNLNDSISQLSSLEILDLHGNQLDVLPKSLSRLSSLKQLNLGLNNLSIFPEWMKSYNLLEVLGLGGNKSLNKIPDWINYLHSLMHLELFDNNINELPEALGDLSSLEVLNLRNNHIKSLPESMGSLNNLKQLNLSWNKFTTLPEWISSLSSLEILNLWGNKIETLPDSISSLKSLKNLNLSFNRIKEIPDSLKKLENFGLVIKI